MLASSRRSCRSDNLMQSECKQRQDEEGLRTFDYADQVANSANGFFLILPWPLRSRWQYAFDRLYLHSSTCQSGAFVQIRCSKYQSHVVLERTAIQASESITAQHSCGEPWPDVVFCGSSKTSSLIGVLRNLQNDTSPAFVKFSSFCYKWTISPLHFTYSVSYLDTFFSTKHWTTGLEEYHKVCRSLSCYKVPSINAWLS